MAKTSKVNIVESWGYEILFPILQDVYRVIYISFQNLFLEKQKNPYTKPASVKKWHLEDLITNDLVRNTVAIKKRFEYRIQKQQDDFETNSKIDIAILYSLTYGDNSNDLKIECKRLDNLIYYFEDGIMGYKKNKYSEKLPFAGMLVYNISGEISQNIENLNALIVKRGINNEQLSQFKIIDENHYSYKSTHSRISNTNIDIYTMALDFKEIIQS
jgi:hypothetical protein